MKNLLLQKQLEKVYRALIESHTSYANVIWGSIPSSEIKIPQNLQERARTTIERARIKDNWSHNWLYLKQLNNFDRLAMTFKILNRTFPESVCDKFPLISLQSNYRTRSCKDFQIPRYSLEYAKKASTIQISLRGTASLSQSGNCQPSRSSKEC